MFLVLILPFMLSCSLGESRIKREKISDSHYKLGIAHLLGKNPALQKAYIEFQKAIKLDGRNQKAHYALGHIFFQQESYEEAVAAFQKAISIDPEYSEAHNYLGRVYSLQENFDKAIAS
ncbi:MAG: tetratricopeptide repeat protein, partial [Nitrospirota bacterium]|nr:tetratricopeptide repeat protein [Nitrospirota bacterium]